MATPVPMLNRATHARATGFSGFSWTTLFFGPFPALMRGHIIAALVMFGVAFFSFGLAWLIFPFVYNGWHWNWLSNKGYVPLDQVNSFGHGGAIQIVNNLGGTTTVAP